MADSKDQEGNGYAEVSLPFFKGKLPTKKAAEFISVLSLGALFFVSYLIFQHSARAETEGKEIKEVITKESSKQLKILNAMLRQATIQTCLQQFDPKDRINKLTFCKELARQAVITAN